MNGSQGTLSRVAIGYSLPEIACTLCFLRAYGIDAVAMPVHTASNAWHLMVAFGGVGILVRDDQASAAASLLASVPQDETPWPRPYARDQLLENALIAILIYFYFSVPPPLRLRLVLRRGKDE